MNSQDLLQDTIEHIDPESFNAVPIIDQMGKMAFQARNLARACRIVDRMIQEDLTVILTLAGGTISAGMKKCLLTMLRDNMVDAIVSTGATMVDMDLFEALGHRHYAGNPDAGEEDFRSADVERVHDTYIRTDDLRALDDVTYRIAASLPPRPHSSRELMAAMGKFLVDQNLGKESVLRTAYEMAIPVFVPSFSDCSAGFGFVKHQVESPQAHCSHDSVADFRELTQVKVEGGGSGMVIIGGGVPKNFTADIVACAEVLGHEVAMHKYAIQLSVADDRDGSASGSAIKEAHHGGSDGTAEQMVFCEFSLALPLLVSYLHHKGDWRARKGKRLNSIFEAGTLGMKP